MPQAVPRPIRIIPLLLALCWAVPAPAQVARSDRIALAEGSDSAIVRGTIRGLGVVDYVIGAEAGRRIQAELTSGNPSVFLNVRAPGAMETTHVGPVRGNVFDGQATAAGDWRLSIFLVGEAARRDEAAEFALSVTVAPLAAPLAVPPQQAAPVPRAAAQPAPSLAPSLVPAGPPAVGAPPREPEAWTITGVPRGQQVNLRAGPSTRDRVVGRLAVRDVVLNRGCRQVEAERWCQVERPDGGATAWVAARFLAAAPPPARAAEATPSAGAPGAVSAPRAPGATPPRAPGATPRRTGGFDATGFLPCAMIRGQTSRECRFGVERSGAGAALLEVLGSNGVTRRIVFERGAPVRADGAGELTFERFGDLFLIRLGDERFEVPEAVVTGG